MHVALELEFELCALAASPDQRDANEATRASITLKQLPTFKSLTAPHNRRAVPSDCHVGNDNYSGLRGADQVSGSDCSLLGEMPV
jgi:hypothetical protein